MDEGYIKYNCIWKEIEVPHNFDLQELNNWRAVLKKENLIGLDNNEIGYGNISIRYEGNTFIITGTQTAHLNHLSWSELSLVESFNISSNTLSCQGLTKASSESMTHGAIYSSNVKINSVVHIHSPYIWQHYQDDFLSTPNVPYGSQDMAMAVKNCINQTDLNNGIIIMKGHENGVIAFGASLKEACLELLKL